MKSHILFYSDGHLGHGFPAFRHIKVNYGHFEFNQVKNFQGASSHEIAHFGFFSNGLAIWYGFPDGRESAIFNLIELTFFTFSF